MKNQIHTPNTLAEEILKGLPHYRLDDKFHHFFATELDLRFFLCHCGPMASQDSDENLELLQQTLPNFIVYGEYIDEIIDIVGEQLVGKVIQ